MRELPRRPLFSRLREDKSGDRDAKSAHEGVAESDEEEKRVSNAGRRRREKATHACLTPSTVELECVSAAIACRLVWSSDRAVRAVSERKQREVRRLRQALGRRKVASRTVKARARFVSDARRRFQTLQVLATPEQSFNGRESRPSPPRREWGAIEKRDRALHALCRYRPHRSTLA